MDFPYEEVFKNVEQSLLAYGAKQRPREEIRNALDRFKTFGERELTDELCFSTLVDVTFYSGMRAATVTSKLAAIHKHFADYRRVSDFGARDIERILADDMMLRNRRKIEACVQNAKVMREIVEQHGSFSTYLAGFDPKDPKGPFENLLLLKEELEARFAYLGGITVYHFMTELGLPVLKPDRVIERLFLRLGLVDRERQHLKTVIHGRKFAEATGLPIRYIDIVLVAFGQVQALEFGIDRGICLEKQPRCQLCSLHDICTYYQENEQLAEVTK